MSVNELMRALTAELTEGERPIPLEREFTLSLVWCELARLAGKSRPPRCSPPPIPPLVPTLIRPGGYAEHALQFAHAD